MILRRKFLIVAGMLLAAIALVLTIAWVRTLEPKLLDRATFVASTANWPDPFDSVWISKHELIYSKFKSNTSSNTTSAKGKIAFFKLDTISHASVDLPCLTALATKVFDYTEDNILVSPDGSYISLGATITTPVGTFIKTLKHQTPVQWAADGSVIVRNDNSIRNSILTLDNITSSERSTGMQLPSDYVTTQPTLYMSPVKLYTIGDWYPEDPSNEERTQVELELRSPLDSRLLRSAQIPLPFKSTVLGIVFSPRGDRILWQLQRRSVSPFETIMKRFLRHRARGAFSYWVSKVDGSDMHEVGSYEISTDEIADDRSETATILSWLPDGRHFSFIYRDKLYTVLAE